MDVGSIEKENLVSACLLDRVSNTLASHVVLFWPARKVRNARETFGSDAIFDHPRR